MTMELKVSKSFVQFVNVLHTLRDTSKSHQKDVESQHETLLGRGSLMLLQHDRTTEAPPRNHLVSCHKSLEQTIRTSSNEEAKTEEQNESNQQKRKRDMSSSHHDCLSRLPAALQAKSSSPNIPCDDPDKQSDLHRDVKSVIKRTFCAAGKPLDNC